MIKLGGVFIITCLGVLTMQAQQKSNPTYLGTQSSTILNTKQEKDPLVLWYKKMDKVAFTKNDNVLEITPPENKLQNMPVYKPEGNLAMETYIPNSGYEYKMEVVRPN